jgi:ribosomal protein S27E
VLAGGLYERTSCAAGQPLAGYRRHTPKRTVLHELVARHAQTMLAELREADPEGGGLPRYVERELAAYLRCDVLARGFMRVRCQTCHDEIIVAFSCKSRGICPSCTARRMADTRRIWSVACCRARRIGNGCSPCGTPTPRKPAWSLQGREMVDHLGLRASGSSPSALTTAIR